MVNAVAAAGIPAVILAHQGGWDEMLLVVGPIAVVGGLLWLARRRVTQAQHVDTHDVPGEVEQSDTPISPHPSVGGHPSVRGRKTRPSTLR